MDSEKQPLSNDPGDELAASAEARQRQEEIAAYLDGEMTTRQAAAFESRVCQDDDLRRELDEWRDAFDAARDWMAADPPGVERVSALRVPQVARSEPQKPKSARVLTIRRFAWRAAAAAALFVGGFLMGNGTQMTGTDPIEPADGARGVRPPVNVVTAPDFPSIGTVDTRLAYDMSSSDTVAATVAELPPRRYTDERGRIVYETTLRETGARAVLVVDTGFQLAHSEGF